MKKNKYFSEDVAEKLGNYVYRLIDPRNGHIFYVGRGKNNRIFNHANGTYEGLKPDEVEAKKIKKKMLAIKNDGFEVQHIIHRHGLSENAAKEVEAALIDAYPGLENIQSGFDSARGTMHTDGIIRTYENPVAKFRHNLLLINVNKSSEERETYDAVRCCWRIDVRRARKCDYVLAVKYGLIIGAFEAINWLPATPDYFPSLPCIDGRHGFIGRKADSKIIKLYVQKRIPDSLRKRGASSPIRYVEPRDHKAN